MDQNFQQPTNSPSTEDELTKQDFKKALFWNTLIIIMLIILFLIDRTSGILEHLVARF